MIKSSLLVEKTKDSKELFKGKLLHVFYDEVVLPNGELSSREWIRHPGACAVVPVFRNGDIMMIRQFRYPMKQIFLEVPAGKIDQGEDPFETAERELSEETGIRAATFHYIGHFYPAIGYADEVIHIFAATGLKESGSDTDEDEFVVNERVHIEQAMHMVHNGIINDGKSVVCLSRVYQWLKEKGLPE